MSMYSQFIQHIWHIRCMYHNPGIQVCTLAKIHPHTHTHTHTPTPTHLVPGPLYGVLYGGREGLESTVRDVFVRRVLLTGVGLSQVRDYHLPREGGGVRGNE